MAETPAPHSTCIDFSTVGEGPGSFWVCGPECPRPEGPGWHDEDAPRTGWPFDREGPAPVPVPAGPDPERDKRIDVYRDRERRRAARALDRYMEVIFEATDPHGVPTSTVNALTVMTASERFVEQVGDYVLARLQPKLCPCATDPTAACTPSPLFDGESKLQQKSHYGVPAANPYEGKSIEELGEIMSSDGYRNPPQHNADSVVPGE